MTSPSEKISKALWGDVDPLAHPHIQISIQKFGTNPFGSEVHFTLSISIEARLPHPALVRRAAQNVPRTRTEEDAYLLLAFKLAPTLYDRDPRIGMPATTNPFPRCPLFDRNDYDVVRGAASIVEGRGLSCSRCGRKPFTPEDSMLWGGGNLGWTHTTCAQGLISV
jgi:hypothetical protein